MAGGVLVDSARVKNGHISATSGVGLCWNCNYDLRGLSENRCPECGKPFNPADPATMNMGRPIGRYAGFLFQPPGIPMHVAVAIGMAWAFVAFAAPGPYLGALILAFWYWVAVLTTWLARLLGFLLAAPFYGQPIFRRQGRSWRRWAVAPVLSLMTCGLIYIDAPFRAALFVSLPALNDTADAALATGAPAGGDRWIGLFPADDLQCVGGGFDFTIRGSGFFDTYGLGRHKTPPITAWRTYRRIWGDWYAWREEW